jgi:uncharacterized protein (DUF433 family)
MSFDRITFNPGMMNGRACIRGMRVTVALILNLVADGMSTAEILDDYPYLEAEDITQAIGIAVINDVDLLDMAHDTRAMRAK